MKSFDGNSYSRYGWMFVVFKRHFCENWTSSYVFEVCLVYSVFLLLQCKSSDYNNFIFMIFIFEFSHFLKSGPTRASCLQRKQWIIWARCESNWSGVETEWWLCLHFRNVHLLDQCDINLSLTECIVSDYWDDWFGGLKICAKW